MTTLLMDRAEAPELDLPEALIDFAEGTWTCREHGTVMRLDSGLDCPECRSVTHPPPRTAIV